MKCGIYFRFNSWSLEAANCQLSFFLLSICPDILHQSRYQITIFNKLALGNFLNTNFFPVVSVVKFTAFTCSKLTTETLEESLNICLKLTIQTQNVNDFFLISLLLTLNYFTCCFSVSVFNFENVFTGCWSATKK